MKEDWTEQMKRKLEGHKMSPPAGLWDSISQQLDKSSGLKPLSRLTGTARRYWAAAAAVLALVGFFVFQNGNDSEQPQEVNEISQQPAPVYHEDRSLDSVQNHGPVPVIHPVLAQTSSPHHATKQEEEKEKTAGPITQEAEPILPESAASTSSESLQTEPVQTQNNQSRQGNHLLDLPDEWLAEQPSLSYSQRWSIGINASGGLLAANNSVRTDRFHFVYGQFNTGYTGIAGFGYPQDSQENTEYTYSYTLTDYVSKHHLPIRFGLSVQYQLNNHLALHSGISYTYLYSEFSIPLYQNIHYNQKLHYLGIPLGVTWQFWSIHHFHFYLSGGMMLEKCVSAILDGSSVSKKPWQWSVDASAGAEYTFTPQLGVYLEPSLGYYFDDGTSLEHYYKEHPLAPSIEFGLRLHLNE